MKRDREAAEAAKGDGEEESDGPVVVDNASAGGVAAAGGASGGSARPIPPAVRSALSRLPSSEMYERSYMHRDWVTHVVITRTDFVITASRDGQLKFWKKMPTGIEFVKHFKAHLAPFAGLAASPDGSFLASTSSDKGLKIFDVLSFDMIAWIKLDFTPGCCEWIGGAGSGTQADAGSKTLLAVAAVEGPEIRMFDAAAGDETPRHVLKIHGAPVLLLKYNPQHGAVISVDARGVIEYWACASPFGLPKSAAFQFKTETDLYALAKAKTRPTALTVSPDGEHFVICSVDAKIRVFHFRSGKTKRT
jgi:peptidylprolyl isomerase domain and WD repeat-containing protein 1